MYVEGASATHVGQVRESNQDRALVTGSLGAVADGMGGHQGGEHAAALAIAELSGVRGALSEARLVDVVKAANLRIFEGATAPEYRGMGTTVVAASFDSDSEVLTIVNVGDSRCYLYRDGDLTQITVDHSLVEDLLRQGRLTEEEAKVHPQRNIVTRALGIGPDVDVDAFAVELQPGDRAVLASDGLFNEVESAGICEILERNPDVQRAADELVETAVANGGRDNVTVVVLDVGDETTRVPADPTEEIEVVNPEGPAEGLMGPGDEPEDQAGETAPPIDPRDDGPEPPDHLAPRPRPKRRRFGFRSLMFAMGVLGVIALAFGGTAFYARSGYYADELDGEVVIMRGRPGGVLWFKPVVEQTTEIQVSDLDESALERLSRRTVWSSLEEAEAVIEILDSQTASSTSSDSDPPGDDTPEN